MTNCTICTVQHDRMFEEADGTLVPSMYCTPCAKRKADAVGSSHRIIEPYIFLGDYTAAEHFYGRRLCVHEQPPEYAYNEFLADHIPLLRVLPISRWNRGGAQVNEAAMDRCGLIIDKACKDGVPLLVHCHGGVERSPLVLAWYLQDRGHAQSLSAAYTLLQRIRPVVADRTEWLPVTPN